MTTDCTPETLPFARLGRREIVARFNGGLLSSDAGALLIREVERKTGILRKFAACFDDYRRQTQIEHTVEELVTQRVLGLVLGYEDLNDHDTLRHDPLFAAAVGKRDPLGAERERPSERGRALASSATLNRLELTPTDAATHRYKRIDADWEAMDRFFVDHFIRSCERSGPPPKEIVLDLDNSDVTLHGCQEDRFYQGHYRSYCYLPLYVFCGDYLLAVRLETADADGARHAEDEIERIVTQIRAAWPNVRIVVRGDSGFCRDGFMSWCEANDVHYVLGLSRNKRLEAKIQPELAQVHLLHEASGEAERVFTEFDYRTLKSWSRTRRVVAKAEQLIGKANPRFVVTTLATEEVAAAEVYEERYCPRGEMENRIKEQQLYLFGARASAGTVCGNQNRMYFSAVAHMLIQALRDYGLRGTSMANARADTIRVKLLKVAARVRITARRIWVELSSNCPFASIFGEVAANLWATPAVVM